MKTRKKLAKLISMIMLMAMVLTSLPMYAGASEETPDPYEVRFMDQGNVLETRYVNPGEAIGTLPAAAEKEGYTFDGWYEAVAGYQVTESTVPEGNMAVRAVYTEIPVTVRHQIDFYSYDDIWLKQVFVNDGETLGDQMPAVPEREGYTFDGWYIITTGEVITADTAITSGMDLIARYTEIPVTVQYQVVFFSYDNTKINTVLVNEGEALGDQMMAAPEREGYTFDGWYEVTTGEPITADTAITHNMGIIARYSQNPVQYEVVFFSYDNKELGRVKVNEGETLGDQMMAGPEREGYTFTGWYEVTGGEAVTAETAITANIGVKAKYEPIHVHEGTLVPAEDPTCTEAGNKAYYTCTCGKLFEDAMCTVEITDPESVKLAALGHTWTDTYEKENADAEKHYHICTVCGVKDDGEAHIPGPEATEESAQNCTVCGYELAPIVEHVHKGTLVPAVEPTCTDGGNKAYYTCRCGKAFEDEACTVEITDLESVKLAPLGHTWTETYEKENADAEKHYHICTVCGVKDDGEAHIPGPEATEESAQNCTVCGYELAPIVEHVHKGTLVPAVEPTCTEGGSKAYYTCRCGKAFEDATCTVEITDLESVKLAPLGHTWTETYEKENADAEKHYHICTVCGVKDDGEAHIPGPEATEQSAQTCTVCGYVLAPALEHVHKGTLVEAKPATHTEAGNKAYYICSCGKYYEDAACTVEIADHNSVIIPAVADHSWDKGVVTKEPTKTETGVKTYTCTICGTTRTETLAKLAETPEDPKKEDPKKDDTKKDPKKETAGTKTPKTADESNAALWLTLFLISGAGLTLVSVYNKKRNVTK